ncbi:MAG: c-type cytochrome [Alishewanella aestuarii]
MPHITRISLVVCLLLPVSSVAATAAGDAKTGQQKSAVCTACHGTDGNSPVPTMYPTLAGQSAEAIIEALIGYRQGTRQGAMANLMMPMAQNLSDEDIADLAAFFSQQLRK